MISNQVPEYNYQNWLPIMSDNYYEWQYSKRDCAKEDIIYLDIHRWLKNNEKIMSTLHKVQVNYGEVEEEQLVLKTQVNYRDLLGGSNGDNIISEKDNNSNSDSTVDVIDADNKKQAEQVQADYYGGEAEPEMMKGPINPIGDATEPSKEA